MIRKAYLGRLGHARGLMGPAFSRVLLEARMTYLLGWVCMWLVRRTLDNWVSLKACGVYS